ncbi:putative knottin, scorpion toxin [Medicago truncatula]|nr:putative knottin, scorpion toxin [Medicago truncatula]
MVGILFQFLGFYKLATSINNVIAHNHLHFFRRQKKVMERKTLASLCFFLIVLLAAQVVAQIVPCKTRNRNFKSACIAVSGDDEECDHDCRRVGGWYGGSCKNQKCVCDC